MKTGLVSVTFRELSTSEVIDMVKKSGLDGIEWSGDVHVPHGDIAVAKAVALDMRDAKLETSAYGSYFQLDNSDFAPVLETAVALQTTVIRVWAGNKDSEKTTEKERAVLVKRANHCVEMCQKAGVDLAFEYHRGTLNDTQASAEQLLLEVPGAYTYWQPPIGMQQLALQRSLIGVQSKAIRLHVFSWEGGERLPLSACESKWRSLFPLATHAQWASIEFVAGDTPRQFFDDAATLKRWLG